MDELIKRLRELASITEHCENIESCDGCSKEDICLSFTNKRIIEVATQAADAIEELQLYADLYKDLTAKGETIAREVIDKYPKWIPVAERLPSDFVSVQAHMTDAGNFPPVREAYVVDKLWFFPALKEFHPVDMWRQFDEPPKEE